MSKVSLQATALHSHGESQPAESCCMHAKGLLSMNLLLRVINISPLHATAEDTHCEAEVMEVRQPQQHVRA